MTPCRHCHSPAAEPSDGADAFCCSGCAAAHALIRDFGLEDYYTLAEDRSPLDRASLSYREFDEDVFAQRFVRELADSSREVVVGIEGLHCAACVWLIERLPRVVEGVISARVDWTEGAVRIRWDPARTRLSGAAAALASLGYRPHPKDPAACDASRRRADRSALVGLGVAAAAAGNNMLLALALYLGDFSGMAAPIEELLRWASGAVGLVSLAGPGRTFFVGAWSSVRTRVPHMDLPIALGLAVGAAAGLVNTVRGEGAIYFDTLSVLVALLLLGRLLQSQQQRRASKAVERLAGGGVSTARKLEGGAVRDVPSEVLAAGDRVQVRAEEVVPGDGRVVAGRGIVDCSVLTGESRPISVTVGDDVFAGTINRQGTLEVELRGVGGGTRLGQLVAHARAGHRAAWVALADRIAGWFVGGVLVLAAATLIGWWPVGPEVAIDHAVAILIVACPCGLALATPLILSVALGRAANRGLLIKHGDVLGRLHKPGRIWLDKTGTLTRGRASLVQWHGSPDVLAAASALERHSAHPIAAAFVAVDSAARCVATEVRHRPGGLEGWVGGRQVAAGNALFIAERCGSVPSELSSRALDALAQALTPVYVSIDGVVKAVAGVGDELRPDAASSVDAMRRRGWEVGILSGDHPEIVSTIGARLGIDPSGCRGGLSPEDKVRVVEEELRRRCVVMIGDGANDSAALAAASVGVATRDGVEASLSSADAYLGVAGVGPLVDLFDIAGRTRARLRLTAAVSLTYNATSVGLAAAGMVSPIVAAVLMPLSSLAVVGLALSLRLPKSRVP